MTPSDPTLVMYPQPRETRVSDTFFSSDADVIFESADGVLLHIHRKNLEICTGAFPPSEIPTNEERVLLSESGETLELLFKFVYPARHPGLEDFGIDVVAPLAEAAEKYEVYSAMNVCQQRMKELIPAHGAKVFLYAAKHDYPTLIIKSLPFVFGRPLSAIIPEIPSHLVLPWVKYTERWMCVIHSLADRTRTRCMNGESIYSYGKKEPCAEWLSRSVEILDRLLQGPKSLLDLDALFQIKGSVRYCCEMALKDWRKQAKEAIEKIPAFQTFVHG